jgi:hypothetical protein
MGAAGTVISLVTPQERFVVERLSNKLEVPILVRGERGEEGRRGKTRGEGKEGRERGIVGAGKGGG